MTLLPDPGEIDALARRIAAHATAARATARRVERDTDATPWQGVAATAFALSTSDTAQALRAAADRLDDAAGALHRHARAVEHALGSLQAFALRTGRALDDVVTALADDAGSVASGIAHLVGV